MIKKVTKRAIAEVKRAVRRLTARCDMHSHPVRFKRTEITENETVFVFECDCGKEIVRIPYKEKK